jgi:type IV pilus assembly protein PilE
MSGQKKGQARLRSLCASHTAKGFTLIEIMVVAAILSILAAIAIPSYSEFTRRVRRADARTTLIQVLQLQERYFTQNNGYCFAPVAACASWPSQVIGGTTTYYNIGSVAGPNGTVIVQAVLAPGWNDPKCLTLTIDSTGNRTASGTSGSASCWTK